MRNEHTNKTVSTAEKVKAIAIAFIGSGIFSQATFYFKEQASYNIPRILYPVFQLLGNKGLAIAMLILGLVLIFWGYKKWKNYDGKVGIFGLATVLSFVVFFSILFLTGNKKATSKTLIKTSEEKRQEGIEKMKAMDKPDFGNKEIDQYFADFNALIKERKEAVDNKDQNKIDSATVKYDTLSEKYPTLIQKLEKPEQKQQFALYNGKLSILWEEIK